MNRKRPIQWYAVRLLVVLLGCSWRLYRLYARHLKPEYPGKLQPYFRHRGAGRYWFLVDSAGGAGTCSLVRYLVDVCAVPIERISFCNHHPAAVAAAVADGVPTIVLTRDSIEQARSVDRRFPGPWFITALEQGRFAIGVSRIKPSPHLLICHITDKGRINGFLRRQHFAPRRDAEIPHVCVTWDFTPCEASKP